MLLVDHVDERGYRQAELFLVYERHIAVDEAGFFEALDSGEGGRRG